MAGEIVINEFKPTPSRDRDGAAVARYGRQIRINFFRLERPRLTGEDEVSRRGASGP